MSDTPNKENIPEPEKMDEIDKFLATLPSLHITDDMIEDEFRPRASSADNKTPVTSVFALLAWLFLLVSLLTAARSLPPRGTAFHSILERGYYAQWNMDHIVTATWYLFGTVFVCVGGLAICLLKKHQMNRGTALSFWIVGGLSAVFASVFLIIQ